MIEWPGKLDFPNYIQKFFSFLSPGKEMQEPGGWGAYTPRVCNNNKKVSFFLPFSEVPVSFNEKGPLKFHAP